MNSIIKDQIFNPSPDIKAYSKFTKQEIPLTKVDLDTNGNIVYLYATNEEQYSSDDVDIYKNFLHVPGVGDIKPGTLLNLDNDNTTYVLLFGWHTNVSNQTIYSWFIRPLTEYSVDEDNDNDNNYMSHTCKVLSQDRTVYLDMINHIWKITP